MPEEYGGAGGTFAHESAIIEAIGHVGVDGFGIALHNAIVAPYILHYGSEEQKKKWLPRMATGELIGAIAMTEPGAGSDLQGVKTRAEKDGNHYRINGSKTFITNGQLANLIIVVAKTDPAQGRQGHLADRRRDRRGRGLRARPQPRQDRPEGERHVGAVLQRRPRADRQSARPRGRPGLRPADAATAAGAPADRQRRRSRMIERALAVTIDYVKERKAFGKAIIDFQNTQFKLAELKTEATIGRVFYNDCVARHIDGGLDPVTASMAKYWLTDLQGKVVDECLQLHGGYGYMNEYPIARMYRDARVQRIYGGTNEIMKLLIARSL